MKTSTSRLVIVDYGTGNLNSIKRTLGRMGIECRISASAEDVERADKIILPGVGHFGRAMSSLNELGLFDALNESVLIRKKPILGICLGMELMAKTSEEGNAEGLGWLDARTIRFVIPEGGRYKVPHMGWNEITASKDSRLLKGVDDNDEFYFAHSYHLELDHASDILAETEYGIKFPSAVEKDNIFGVQFHPEKSRDAGPRLLMNFMEM